MNCKQGDLAIIVKSNVDPRNRGKIVSILRPSHANDTPVGGGFVEAGIPWRKVHDGFVWLIKCPNGFYGSPPGVTVMPCYDKCLRPLRDKPGEDEMLRIAGKPVFNNQKEYVKCK